MKHIILIVSLLMGVTLGVQAQPKALFDKTTHEFGTILWKNPVTATFKITNKGDKPLVISNVTTRLDKEEIEFEDANKGDKPTMELLVANTSDKLYTPVLMHLPPYLSAVATPEKLGRGRTGKIKITLDTDKLPKLGLTTASVYLSRFPGDKVGEENEIPVSAILLPDFSHISQQERLNPPAIHLSAKELQMGELKSDEKKAHTIIVKNVGKSNLEILDLQVFNSALGVQLKKRVLKPGASTKLKITAFGRREFSVGEYVEGIVKGDVTVLSQAVTLVESVKPEHQAIAQEVIEKCLPYSGNSMRIGISGVPGAGKSTSIDVFGLHVLEKGGKLAVLAIDPSSERSKGSILGDKTRMEKLSVHPKSFIRPSPSAGSLGGVARKTRETIILCEAAGFDKIFVETVGVGQSETAVHSMVDFFLLIQLAGTGDELQGIKRGIMEMADGIVINKADGSNIEKAKLAASHFRNALHLFPAPDSGWSPKVMTYSGFYGIGIKEIWDMIYEYFAFVKANGYFEYRRNEQAKYWMYESINEHLRDSFYNNEKIISMLAAKEEEVLNGKLTSFVAAKKLLDAYFSTLK